MTFALPILTFFAAFLGVQKSIGHGISAMLAAGYFYGIIRANYLDVYSTFSFDAAVLGFYAGYFLSGKYSFQSFFSSTLGRIVAVLMIWPTLLSLIPVNHLLIQFVALRASIWFLPLMIIASNVKSQDIILIARTIAVLDLISLGFGFYLYLYGIESLYPHNAVTQIMYQSNDVADGFHRIPSTFLTAHMYGGTMLGGLPLLLGRFLAKKVGFYERILLAVGLLAAIMGILLCAARSPIIIAMVSLVIFWVLTQFSLRVGLIVAIIGLVMLGLSLNNDRLQRASSLLEGDTVTNRIQSSANSSFWDILAEYPLGAGMGSAAGTSIPHFLAEFTPDQIGLENEYSRFLVDQGWIGLALWVGFILWLFLRPVSIHSRLGKALDFEYGMPMVYALSAAVWATAFIGSGLLTSIPLSAILLLQMGLIARVKVE